MVFMVVCLLGFESAFEGFEAGLEFFEFLDAGEVGCRGDKLGGCVRRDVPLGGCGEDGLCGVGLVCSLWQWNGDRRGDRA